VVARRTHGSVAARASVRTSCWRCSPCKFPLGIATLLLVVPLPLAAAHQAGAVPLFTLALHLCHALRPRSVEWPADRSESTMSERA
jgi:hypothetical protein